MLNQIIHVSVVFFLTATQFAHGTVSSPIVNSKDKVVADIQTFRDLLMGSGMSPLTPDDLDTVSQIINNVDPDAPWRISYAGISSFFGEVADEFLSPSNPKIFYLTPEIQKLLGFTQKQNPKGVYIPVLDIILIQPELDKRAIEHEFIHAFQYRYRFPSDLAQLEALGADQLIPELDIPLFLHYFYETQAHWYLESTEPSPKWENYRDKIRDRTYLTHHSITLPPVLLFGVALVFIKAKHVRENPIPKAVVNLPWYYRLHESERYDPMPGYFLMRAPELMPEMLTYESSLTGNPEFQTAFKIQTHYARRIERQYFGRIPFLFNDRQRKTLGLYTRLYDAYFNSNSELNKSDESLATCRDLHARLRIERQGTQVSPLIQWLTISESDAKSCVLYQEPFSGLDTWQRRTANSKTQSPFRVRIHQGGSGSDGSMDIHPQLEIKP